MSKVIEAFIRLDHNTKRYKGRKEDLDIVFSALKDYEMEHTLRIRLEDINYELVRETQITEWKLKALAIIKEKSVDVQLLKDIKNVPNYNWCVHTKDRALTEEEFKLLKEVLL